MKDFKINVQLKYVFDFLDFNFFVEKCGVGIEKKLITNCYNLITVITPSGYWLSSKFVMLGVSLNIFHAQKNLFLDAQNVSEHFVFCKSSKPLHLQFTFCFIICVPNF